MEPDYTSQKQWRQVIGFGSGRNREKQLSKARILICGCGYGAGNIGDDAILVGLASSFRRVLPSALIGAVSFSPSFTSRELPLDACWGVCRDEAIAAVNWSTHVVLGGGTLLAAREGLDFALAFATDWIDLALAIGRPVAALGVGVSDMDDGKYRRMVARKWQELTLVTVRSAAEKTLAENLGLMPERIVVCADAAFCCDLPARVGNHCSTGAIAINLVNDDPERASAFGERLSTALRRVCEGRNACRVVGICSETRRHSQFDYEITKKVVDGVDRGTDIFAEYVGPGALCKRLASMRLVVTMRMHVLLFCARMGVPCIAVARESKVRHMAQELGIPPPLDVESPASDVEECIRLAVRQPSAFVVEERRIVELEEKAESNVAVWAKYQAQGMRRGTAMGRVAAKARWAVGVGSWRRVSWQLAETITSRAPYLTPRCKCLQ
jgi:polysaccharide pyruvyl transferase WcaK-like protein